MASRAVTLYQRRQSVLGYRTNVTRGLRVRHWLWRAGRWVSDRVTTAGLARAPDDLLTLTVHQTLPTTSGRDPLRRYAWRPRALESWFVGCCTAPSPPQSHRHTASQPHAKVPQPTTTSQPSSQVYVSEIIKSSYTSNSTSHTSRSRAAAARLRG